MKIYIITLVLVLILCKLADRQGQINTIPDCKYIKPYEVKNGLVPFFLAGCILVFVAGFRYRVGTDYWSYYGVYKGDIQDLLQKFVDLDEPGYSFLSWLSTRILYDGATVIFMSSLITISLALVVIFRNSEQLLLSMILYIALGCWHGSFNGIRQYLAASIVFCGFRFLKERKFLKYCIVIFLAFLFHRSAIIMLPAYFLVNRAINIRNIMLDIFSIIIVLISFERLFIIAGWIMDKNYSISDEYASTVVNAIRVASACIPAFVFLIAYLGKELTELETIYLNFIILNASFCIMTMNSALLYRIGIYTSLFQVLSIPALLKQLPDTRRRLFTVCFLIMYVGMWWYEIFTYKSLNNFQWIWQR